MKILVIGGGGREHTIVWKLLQSEKVTEVFCAPGNAGIAMMATCVPIAMNDFKQLVLFAKEKEIDLTVVGNEEPLVLGIVDAFEAEGLAIFGPSQAAATIEGSKVFSKGFMKKYGIPTAYSETFTDLESAVAYVQTKQPPYVIKTDGLALGKGVVICDSIEAARAELAEILVHHKFGAAGKQVVIEEFLTGHEVTVLAFCDGETMIPMVSAQDYKRALDHDEGLNTGGMGAISPSRYYTEAIEKECWEQIFKKTIEGLNKEGRTFKGVLYFGLMLGETGVKVIEYNCRFGDPETQVLLPRLETDLLDILLAVVHGNLKQLTVKWKQEAAVCVMMASGGYPLDYKKGLPITGLDLVSDQVTVFHSGTALENDTLVTSGGRVLGVSALAADLETAAALVYENIAPIRFGDRHFRKDIGKQ